MTTEAGVDAIVLAAGQGERLGLGPKAWLGLGGRSLLERAVATMRQVADRVIVGVAAADLERARQLCDVPVVVVSGGATHRATMLAAVAAATAPLVLVHDVAHPFVTSALARAVIAAARRRGAAVAAVPATTTSYRAVAGEPPARLAGEIWSIRRPIVLPRASFTRGLDPARPDEALTVILERVGVRTELVPCPSWNVKLTTLDDWALAGAIEAVLRPVP